MKRIRWILPFVMVAVLVAASFPIGGVQAVSAGPVTSTVKVTPNPATINTLVTVTATVDDTAGANVNILSAEFSVNGGAWTAMTASDGAFDTPKENVTGTFTATPAGTYNVCVQGEDVSLNVGEPVCTSLTVQYLYTFSGFGAPIKMGKVNKAKAGQDIPLKWKLTLTSNKAPVKAPGSFVAVKSYAVNCTTWAGDISTAVVEKGPGKSGLKYLGRGTWQFNWKTPKSYKNSCRMMFVLFSDGLMSQQVSFSFK